VGRQRLKLQAATVGKEWSSESLFRDFETTRVRRGFRELACWHGPTAPERSALGNPDLLSHRHVSPLEKKVNVDVGLLGCDAVWTCSCMQTFQKNILLSTSDIDGGSMFLMYISIHVSPHSITVYKTTVDYIAALWTLDLTQETKYINKFVSVEASVS
jgi:hypothetical protein